MNIKKAVYCILAVLFVISCDEETSGLGGSLTPADDIITVTNDTCYASSSTIKQADSIATLTTVSALGRFTEEVSGARIDAGYMTQLNCMEGFYLPDSVYGIGNHSFPQWFLDTVSTLKPYYAELKLYYSSYFGDSTNTVRIDVYQLDRMIDANATYYPNIDPATFCNTSKPFASVTVSGWNLQQSDSIRSLSGYYPCITIPMPDSLAGRILNSYYSNPEYFENAETFMENIVKGFYIRCTQGDGTIFYIDRTILGVNFKSIGIDDDTDEPVMMSQMAEFQGNEEVVQLSCYKWDGLESNLSESDYTWIRTPFGLLTEVELPIDRMKDDEHVLNAANITLYTAKTPSHRFKPSVPSTLLLIRKDMVQEFFKENNTADSKESFIASYASKYGSYTYDNIAALVEKIFSDREEWLKENKMQLDDAGKAAYQVARPDWDKVVLIPVKARLNSSSSVISYMVDPYIHQVKLMGGSGSQIKIKTIKSKF